MNKSNRTARRSSFCESNRTTRRSTSTFCILLEKFNCCPDYFFLVFFNVLYWYFLILCFYKPAPHATRTGALFKEIDSSNFLLLAFILLKLSILLLPVCNGGSTEPPRCQFCTFVLVKQVNWGPMCSAPAPPPVSICTFVLVKQVNRVPVCGAPAPPQSPPGVSICTFVLVQQVKWVPVFGAPAPPARSDWLLASLFTLWNAIMCVLFFCVRVFFLSCVRFIIIWNIYIIYDIIHILKKKSAHTRL